MASMVYTGAVCRKLVRHHYQRVRHRFGAGIPDIFVRPDRNRSLWELFPYRALAQCWRIGNWQRCARRWGKGWVGIAPVARSEDLFSGRGSERTGRFAATHGFDCNGFLGRHGRSLFGHRARPCCPDGPGRRHACAASHKCSRAGRRYLTFLRFAPDQGRAPHFRACLHWPKER